MNYNPIKASDLFIDDGAIDALIEKVNAYDRAIALIDKQKAKVAQQARAEAKAYASLNATQIEHQQILEDEIDASEALVKQQKQLQRARERMEASLSSTAKELAAVKEQQRQLNQVNRLEAKLNAAKEGSYDALSAQLSINKIRLKQYTEEERSSNEEARKLVEETNNINDALKRMDKEVGVTSRNVGNYEESIRKALQEQNALYIELEKTRAEMARLPKSAKKNTELMKEYAQTIAGLESELSGLSKKTGQTTKDLEDAAKATDGASASLSDMPGAAGAAGKGIQGLSAQFKALIRNPIIAVIAAIVAGLTALGAAFTRSEKGAILMEKVSGRLGVLFDSLVAISLDLFEAIQGAFENPKQAVIDLGTAIKNDVVNRFEGVINLAKSVGAAIKAAFTLDTEGLKQAGKDAGDALTQVATGLDEVQREKAGDYFAKVAEETRNAAKASDDLVDARRALRKENRELTKTIEAATTQEEKYQRIADDNTRGQKERTDAAIDALKFSEQRAAAEAKLAENNLSLINQEIALRQRSGQDIENLYDQQIQAISAVEQAERGLAQTRFENEKVRRELAQDFGTRDLDVAVDLFDAVKTVNERLIEDEELTLAERGRILDELRRTTEESYAAQERIIQQFTERKIDLNRLAAISDVDTFNAEVDALGLSDQLRGELLQVIRDRIAANQDLEDASKSYLAAVLEQAAEEGASFEERRGYLEDYVNAVEDEYARAVEAAKGQENEAQLIERAEQRRIARLEKGSQEATKIKDDELAADKERLDKSLALYDLEEQIAVNNIEAAKGNERKKQVAILEIQAEFLKKRIAALKAAGTEEANAQAELLASELAKIESQLDGLDQEPRSIWELLGLDLEDGQEQALTSVFQGVKQQLLELANLRAQLAQQSVQRADNEVAEAQRALDAEIANRNAGFAHEVDTAKKRLAEAKKNQQEALKEQERAQRQQQIIQAAQQSANLITASSKILAEFTPLAAIPILALMWGTFISAQARAAQLTKRQFGEGGFEVVGGGSHASGNDTYAGFSVDGQPAYVERGEGVGIIKRSQMSRVGGVAEEFINKANAGRLTDGEIQAMSDVMNGRVAREINSYPIRAVNEVQYILQPQGATVNTSTMEKELAAIRKQGEIIYDAKGRMIKWGSTRYVYST